MGEDEREELVERCERLLEGRVEYTRTNEDGMAVRGAVDVVYGTDAVDDFESQAAQDVRDLGWAFVRLERVDWFTTDGARLALAVEALETNAVAFGTAYEWPDVPETVDPEETTALEDAREARRLVYARTEDADTLGFVVAFSDELVLVHHFDQDFAGLNGYRALPRHRLTRLVELEEESGLDEGKWHFLHAATAARGVSPTDPGAPVEDLPSFLRWAGRMGLVGVYEYEPPYGRFVGAVASVDEAIVTLQGVSRTGEWTGPEHHPIDAISRVDVLDGYLRALEAAAGPSR